MPYDFYAPNRYLKLGIKIWLKMFKELIRSRELIWRLFVRDFLAKYKQTVLGILWAIIMPLLMVGSFVLLNRSGLLNIGKTAVAYPVFALVGLSIWQLFATGLVACANSILQAGGMVVKVNFPKESLVIAALAQSIFEFLVRIGLLVAVFAIYRVVPSWMAVFLPLVLIPLMLLTLGLGFLFALLNVLVRDIGNIVTLMTTFMLFLTPVLYPAPSSGFFAFLSICNPLSALVTGARDLVLSGSIKEPFQFLLASLVSLVIFLISWRIFYLAESRMPERV
jgi:lipopolysaccharide transport system permease protein